MDFLDFVFTPAAYAALLGSGVVAGVTVGVLFVLLTLFYGRRS